MGKGYWSGKPLSTKEEDGKLRSSLKETTRGEEYYTNALEKGFSSVGEGGGVGVVISITRVRISSGVGDSMFRLRGLEIGEEIGIGSEQNSVGISEITGKSKGT